MDQPEVENEEDVLIQSSGIWLGQILKGEEATEVSWNLTITPNTPYPSVFGGPKSSDSVLQGSPFLSFFLISFFFLTHFIAIRFF